MPLPLPPYCCCLCCYCNKFSCYFNIYFYCFYVDLPPCFVGYVDAIVVVAFAISVAVVVVVVVDIAVDVVVNDVAVVFVAADVVVLGAVVKYVDVVDYVDVDIITLWCCCY